MTRDVMPPIRTTLEASVKSKATSGPRQALPLSVERYAIISFALFFAYP